MSYKNLISIIIITIFIFFLDEYLLIPNNIYWNSVENYLNNNAKIGQQIVFCPGYLLNYAKESHLGKFNNFDAKKKPDKSTSIYDTYWILGTCKKQNYLEKKTFEGGINLYKMEFSDYKEVNPFLTRLYKEGNVSVVRNGNIKRCVFKDDHFDCGYNYWEKVKVINTTAGGEKIKCLLAHPFDYAELRLEYKNLPSGKLIFGFVDTMANDETNTEDIIFKINDDTTVILNRDNRYQELNFEGGKLLLSVTTTRYFKKHVCFNLLED